MINKELIDKFRVRPGKSVDLSKYETAWSGPPELARLGKDAVKETAKEILKENLAELTRAQEVLWASDTYSVLIIVQAMDAAGKDGLIKHVMSGVNPQGCEVKSFKQPTSDELDHSFLWRVMRALPERGKICIFNRSHYEDVLVVRVHPEYLRASKLPQAHLPELNEKGNEDKSFWKERFEDINAFEQHLTRNGTVIRKFFLHVSKEEQKERFLDRLKDPNKLWKFSLGDVEERRHWEAYQSAYEEMLAATSTDAAPWYVIPADHKWVARAMVADVITTTIRELGLSYPEVSATQKKAYEQAKKELESH